MTKEDAMCAIRRINIDVERLDALLARTLGSAMRSDLLEIRLSLEATRDRIESSSFPERVSR